MKAFAHTLILGTLVCDPLKLMAQSVLLFHGRGNELQSLFTSVSLCNHLLPIKGWRASVVRDKEVGRFHEVAGVSIIAMGGPR